MAGFNRFSAIDPSYISGLGSTVEDEQAKKGKVQTFLDAIRRLAPRSLTLSDSSDEHARAEEGARREQFTVAIQKGKVIQALDSVTPADLTRQFNGSGDTVSEAFFWHVHARACCGS